MKKSVTLILFVYLFFTISAQNSGWNCGDLLSDIRDGKSYQTLLIGNQCWMAENLNYGTMINSTAAGFQMTENSVFEKYCWNNEEDYCNGTNGKTKQGGFYEWMEAVQNYNGQPTLPVQGVCPSGWHIPTLAEFETLITELGGSAVAGGKMKEGGASGFNGKLTGYRCTMSGTFRKSALGVTWSSYFWVSEQSDAGNAYFYELTEDNASFAQCVYSPFSKAIGNSIRCIKDESSSNQELKQDGAFYHYLRQENEQKIVLELFSPLQENVEIRLIDLQGKVINVYPLKVLSGDQQIELSCYPELNGFYIVQYVSNSYLFSAPFYIR